MAVMEEEQQAGIPEWVVTFGDMMSLLLTFFIMLFGMSEIKQEQKFQALMESLRHQFGYDTAMLSAAPGRSSSGSGMASISTERRLRSRSVHRLVLTR